jgi:hypothetical protein
MKWSRVLTDATTSLFGITPPEPKDETRYALLVVGLILGIGVCSAGLLWILIPILMDQR